MAIEVIGVGVGRTGTHSLKLAITELGLGPCHHMEEVLHNMPTQVPLWQDALRGAPAWESIYSGYRSAVDWPTAGFFPELLEAYPSAKFVLTHRAAEDWADSYLSTIRPFLGALDDAPDFMQAGIPMAIDVAARSGFPLQLDRTGLIEAFEKHCRAVVDSIPADRLLLYRVADGWQPLCDFLDKPVPATQFPRTNDRDEFWQRFLMP